MPVTRAIITLSLPSILSMMVTVLYNLADTFYIGKLGDPDLVAALSISMPLFTLQMATAGIFGHGGGSYVSRLLGRKDYVTAHETATTALFSMAIASILFGILGVFGIPLYLKIVGASPNIYPHAYKYMFWILLGTPFTMAKFAQVQLLRSEGAAKAAMVILMIGTITNIVLDPIFIFGFKMGVTGAAVATIIGQAFASLYAFYYYRSGRTLITPKLKYLRPKLETYKQIFYIGIPSSLSQITLAIGNTVAYNMASRFGDAHVAAIGVAGRVFSIATFVFIGTSVGTQALIGFNYGARNYTRMKRVMRTAMTMTLSYGAGLTLIFALLPETLISIFIKDPEVKVYGALTLQAYVFAIPTASVGMILMSSLQAMGKALQAFLVAISRQGVIYIPLLHILTHFFGFQGLVLAMPASDFLTTSMSFIFVLNIVRKLKHTQTVDFDPAKLETSDLLGT